MFEWRSTLGAGDSSWRLPDERSAARRYIKGSGGSPQANWLCHRRNPGIMVFGSCFPDHAFRMIIQSASLQVPRLDDVLIIMEAKNREVRGV